MVSFCFADTAVLEAFGLEEIELLLCTDVKMRTIGMDKGDD